MNDQIRELDVFVRLADEKNFSAAARALNCTPSAISKLVQRLEDRLGVRLFHRTSRVLKLTQEGEQFMDAAQRVLDALREAEEGIGRSKLEVSGALRINTTLTFAHNMLAPLLPELLKRHPHLRVEFMLTATPVDLFENQIDVSIQSGHIADSTLIAKRIAGSRWMICASPDYLRRRGRPETPADLAAHNCLNFMPGTYRSQWPLYDGKTILKSEPTGTVRANSAELLKVFACAGVGIARLADFHVAPELASGALVPLLEEFHLNQADSVYAIYPSKRHLNARVKTFLDFLEENLSASA
ncbi:MAG: LysR substrate-binding domain-containing protein [Janthinobacterium lividum]